MHVAWTALFIGVCSVAALGAEGDAPSPDAPLPGVMVVHRSATGGVYLGTPSLAKLPDGRLVASHDTFGPQANPITVFVYGSEDSGATWRLLSKVEHQGWSNLFWHRGALYLLGTTGEYGPIAIRRSDDGGRHWTEPEDNRTG